MEGCYFYTISGCDAILFALEKKDAPALPPPDFFIGARAQVLGWSLATAGENRFKTYFPAVSLIAP